MLSKLAFGFAFFAIAVIFISSNFAAAFSLTEYDNELAWQALWYAKAASCTDASIVKDWTCPGCQFHPRFQLLNVHTNSTVGDLAFTGYDPELKAIVASYQGTEDIAEALIDADFTQIQYPHGPAGALIHAGFWETWQSYGSAIIWDMFSLLQLHPDAKMIISTGHSLGGAASLLGSLETVRLLRMNSSLPQIPVLSYTYGQPRVGNPVFSDYVYTTGLQSPHKQYRVVNKNDIVPHLPFNGLPKNAEWLHAPQEIWYKDGGNVTYKVCHGTGTAEDPTCSDSEIDLSIADHLVYLGVKTACGASADEDARRLKMIAKLRKNPKYQTLVRQMMDNKLQEKKQN